MSLEGAKLVILPAHESKVTFERLLAQVTDDNMHHEVNTGPAVGNEASKELAFPSKDFIRKS